MYRQEEAEQRQDQGAGEDQCHPSAYNRRLRATQSPNEPNTHSVTVRNLYTESSFCFMYSFQD